MALRPSDGVGVSTGQPDRIDQNSQAYQERLRAGAQLEIPKTGIDRTRTDPHTQEQARTGGGWQAQERAAGDRGAAWQNGRLDSWRSFSGGRGRQQPDPQLTSGAIVIDGRSSPSVPVNRAQPREPTPTPNNNLQRDVWASMRHAHQRAARFEEYNRESVSPFLSSRPKQKRESVRRGVVLKDR